MARGEGGVRSAQDVCRAWKKGPTAQRYSGVHTWCREFDLHVVIAERFGVVMAVAGTVIVGASHHARLHRLRWG